MTPPEVAFERFLYDKHARGETKYERISGRVAVEDLASGHLPGGFRNGRTDSCRILEKPRPEAWFCRRGTSNWSELTTARPVPIHSGRGNGALSF